MAFGKAAGPLFPGRTSDCIEKVLRFRGPPIEAKELKSFERGRGVKAITEIRSIETGQ